MNKIPTKDEYELLEKAIVAEGFNLVCTIMSADMEAKSRYGGKYIKYNLENQADTVWVNKDTYEDLVFRFLPVHDSDHDEWLSNLAHKESAPKSIVVRKVKQYYTEIGDKVYRDFILRLQATDLDGKQVFQESSYPRALWFKTDEFSQALYAYVAEVGYSDVIIETIVQCEHCGDLLREGDMVGEKVALCLDHQAEIANSEEFGL